MEDSPEANIKDRIVVEWSFKQACLSSSSATVCSWEGNLFVSGSSSVKQG